MSCNLLEYKRKNSSEMKSECTSKFYVENVEKFEGDNNSVSQPKKDAKSTTVKSYNSCPSPSTKEENEHGHIAKESTEKLKRCQSENSSNSIDDIPMDGSSYVPQRKNSIQERRSVRKGSREGNLTLELNDKEEEVKEEVKLRPKSFFPCRSAPPVELRRHRNELKNENNEFNFDIGLPISKSPKLEKEKPQTPSPIRKRFTLHLPLKSRHHSQSPARRSPKSSSRSSLFNMSNTSPGSSSVSPVKFLTPPSTPSSTFYVTPPDSPKDLQTPSPTKKGKSKLLSPLAANGKHSSRLRHSNSSGNIPLGFFASVKERCEAASPTRHSPEAR
ncbi:UNVERIFIED_CONTAM: hypothetical protein RMT77_016044 [Armadillidium vulgare]